MVFNATFNKFQLYRGQVAVTFIGGGNLGKNHRPVHKSLTNTSFYK